MPSYVHLNFSCNVIVTRRDKVLRTFERAIHAFSRPVDPEIQTGVQQVRVWQCCAVTPLRSEV